MEHKLVCQIAAILPSVEEWLRATVRDEMERTLERDHMKKKPTKQLSREEVCKILGVSLPTLWARTKAGEIKATHIGRRVVYDESEINRFLGK